MLKYLKSYQYQTMYIHSDYTPFSCTIKNFRMLTKSREMSQTSGESDVQNRGREGCSRCILFSSRCSATSESSSSCEIFWKIDCKGMNLCTLMVQLLTLEEVFSSKEYVEKAGGVCPCWGRKETWPKLQLE